MRRAKTKGIKRQRTKPPTPTGAINVLIGDEERKGKQTKKEKERNRERDPNPATLDHLVASYDPHGSYGGPILKPLRPQGEYNKVNKL